MFSSNPWVTIASDVELVPVDCLTPLDLAAVYGRDAPLEIDLGCGDGSFLAAIAAENPAKNFLGIERLLGRVRTACRKVEHAALTNVRVLRFEISYAVERLLPPGSVTAFHLMFPDPWPKRRHAPRRLVTQNFLVSMHRALVSQGTVRIATDQAAYFDQIRRLVSASELFHLVPEASLSGAVSKFEERFRQKGVPIQRLALRKVSPVRNDVASQ